MDNNSPAPQKNTEGGIGPVVGALIIVVILSIAAIYYWGQHLNLVEEQQQLRSAQEAAFQASVTGFGTTTSGSASSTLRSTLGTSTKISDMEKDLNSVK